MLNSVTKKNSCNQSEDSSKDEEVLAQFDEWTGAAAAFVCSKRKVEPSQLRA